MLDTLDSIGLLLLLQLIGSGQHHIHRTSCQICRNQFAVRCLLKLDGLGSASSDLKKRRYDQAYSRKTC
jgi:hypothetical protein